VAGSRSRWMAAAVKIVSSATDLSSAKLEAGSGPENIAKSDPRNWPEIVRQYEALKSIKEIHAGPLEDVSLDVIRVLIASSEGLRPEEVTEDRLKLEADLVLRHYGAVRFIQNARTKLPVAATETPARSTVNPGKKNGMLRRSEWLESRLLERGWSHSDSAKYCGPDRKTIEKIIRGESVRNDVLEKLAVALSKKFAVVKVLDIPRD
jgi:hypothetical protein